MLGSAPKGMYSWAPFAWKNGGAAAAFMLRGTI